MGAGFELAIGAFLCQGARSITVIAVGNRKEIYD